MEVIQTKKIVSAKLAEVLVSAEEIEVYLLAVDLALTTLSDEEIENRFGASRNELEGILEDLKLASKLCAGESKTVLA
jgi:hypothetical protein